MTSRGSKRSYEEAVDTETRVDSALKFPRVGEEDEPCTVIVSNLPSQIPNLQHALTVYLERKYRTVSFLGIKVDSYSAEVSVKTSKQAIHVQKQLHNSVFEGHTLQCDLVDSTVDAHVQNQLNNSEFGGRDSYCAPIDSMDESPAFLREKPFVVLRKDCAIHIRRIPSGTTMREVATALKERIATLTSTEGFRSDDVEIRDSILTHHGTSAIVEFTSPKFANLAVEIETCNGKKINISHYRDTRIDDPSIDKKVTTVVIRNLPALITARELTDFLIERIETAYFSEVKVQKCVVTNNRSFAYMQFDSHLDAYGATKLRKTSIDGHVLKITRWRRSKSSIEMTRRLDALSFEHEGELDLCTLCASKDEKEPTYPTESEHRNIEYPLDRSPGDVRIDNLSNSKNEKSSMTLQSSQVVSPQDVTKHPDANTSCEDKEATNIHTDSEYTNLYEEYSELSERHNALKANHATSLKEIEELQCRFSMLAKEKDTMKAVHEAKALENEQLTWRLESSEQAAKDLASVKYLLQEKIKELNVALEEKKVAPSDHSEDQNTDTRSLLENKLASYEEQVKELTSTLQQLREESMEEKRELRQEKRDLREEKQELKDKLKIETERRLELEKELANARRHGMARNASQHIEVVPERVDSAANQPKSENDKAQET